ncbi:receptor-like protein CLAVATA2 [Hibiscus syriacus]|uniref:receptor-like protein CLAVATA2 n=1 Tax=Hibiscus syriacus TaxID=106335 RepID=UPI001923C51C|nr:receptor-like protein CLAVATA2 [Hibiscus syriacus]
MPRDSGNSGGDREKVQQGDGRESSSNGKDGKSGEDVCSLRTNSSAKDTKPRIRVEQARGRRLKTLEVLQNYQRGAESSKVMDEPRIELSREVDEPRIEEALRLGSVQFVTAKASRSQFISQQELGGILPRWIGNFSSNLEKLDLSSNSFHGKIPDCLFHLKSLRHLNLGGNDLSGNAHEFYQSLEYLSLPSNKFFGTLPCFSAVTKSLTFLTMANNSLVGGIPTCIGSQEVLSYLNLSFNHLSYGISPRLVFTEKFLALDLSFNDLSGPLPGKITAATEKSGILFLDLSKN